MPRLSSLAKFAGFCFGTIVLQKFSFVVAINPIIQTKFTADPAPMVWNSTVYVFTDHDNDGATTSFDMTNWLLYSTTDMVNYVDLGSPLALADFSWASYNAWAAQEWKVLHDPIGKPLVTTSTGNIDPTVFIDEDGQAYLYSGNPALYYVKLNEDMISYSGNVESVPLTTQGFGVRPGNRRPTTFEEGPWFYKRNGLYYMIYSANCCPEDIRYSTSTGPTGPWQYQGLIMAAQEGCDGNHAGVIDYKGNSYFFYHNQNLTGGGRVQRSVCVEQFKYDSNGSIPSSMLMTYTGAPQVGTFNPYQRVEAETMADSHGIKTQPCSQGTQNIASIQDGSWLMVQGVDFGPGASNFTASVASGTQGGNIELRLGSVTGTLVGTLAVPGTGGWQSWKTVSTSVKGAEGIQNLYLVFKGQTGFLLNIDYWSFSK